MKNNEETKGVILEQYEDRIILSTFEGEKTVMKSEISGIVFDLEEQNLTSIGDFYRNKGMYERAYYYYSEALKVNPDYKEARDGLDFTGIHIQQRTTVDKLEHVKRLNETERSGVAAEKEIRSAEEKVDRAIGIVINDTGGIFEISSVKRNSPASGAGIKKGDRLISIWGKAVGYLCLEEVLAALSNPVVMDARMRIERSVKIKPRWFTGSYEALIDAEFGFSKTEGLVVKRVEKNGRAERAGLEKGDIVTTIGGRSTRYMPLKEAAAMVSSKRGKPLLIVIRRDIKMWKSFE